MVRCGLLFGTLFLLNSVIVQSAIAQSAPKADDPHLLLWLDASDAGTLTVDADERVSAWANKAKQVAGKFTSSDKNRPLYVEQALGGRPTIRFDGTDDILRNTQFGRAEKNWTLAAVVTPRSNKGNGQFHGIFSATRPKMDDFVTGLNVDLGSIETASFSDLNLEGAKDYAGVRNLRTEASNFGEGQVLVIVTDTALSKLFVGLEAENMRFAGDAANSMEEVRLGGRFFAGGERGFLDGDISEVLLFDTAIADEARIALTKYLAQKYDCASKVIEYSYDGAWTALKSYDGYGSRLTLTPIDQAIRKSHGDASQRKDIEQRLIGVLQSDATTAAKEFACRRLIHVGTAESTPALAKFLVDPKLGPVSQITVQAIPGEASVAAIRQAVEKAPLGRQLSLIQSLGLLKDQKAVPILAALSESSKSQVAEAAARALGKIGSPDCIAPLQQYLKKAGAEQRAAAFDANLLLAFRLLEQNKQAESAKILHTLEPLANEAGRSAILAGLVDAEPQKAAALLLQGLADKSARIRGEAAQVIRMTKQSELLKMLPKHFAEIPREGQILLLDAIGQRKEKAVKPAVLEALKSKGAEVRTAALSLLGTIGDQSDIAGLARMAAVADSTSEKEAAFRSLAQLQGEGIDDGVIGQLGQANAAVRAVAVRALAARQSYLAFEDLAKVAKDSDATVRAEAGKALLTLANEQSVGRLVQLLLDAANVEERTLFEQALIAGCMKIADPDKRAELILAKYARANEEGQGHLLPVLGALGGEKTNSLIHAAIKDQAGKLYEPGLRALANWPDATVVPELLMIAKNATPSHRSWAIRGVARVAPRPGQLPPPEAFAVLQKAFEMADRLDDKKLVLTRMGAVRTAACLAFAVAKIDDAALQTEAIATTVKLAEGMKESHPKEAKAAFERVLAVSQDAALKAHIERLLGKIKP